MNDPKEIAAGIVTKYWPFGDLDKLKALFEKDIAAAIQAEREDGCRRVNDAIGDRDPIIENLKAELERVKAERDEAVGLLEPFAEHARNTDASYPNAYPDNAEVGTRLGWCRAARAFVEKVKQHTVAPLDIRNPVAYKHANEQPQPASEADEAET
jgi:hypothetical protein